jgi:hypothetical protein
MDNNMSRRGFVSAASIGISLPGSGPITNPEAATHANDITIVRPEMFGAVPDGVIDSTNAFERAIKFATSERRIANRQRNIPIVLSSGVYRLTRAIIFSGQDISITGTGAQSCALLLDHEEDGILYSGGGDVTFAGFTLMSTPQREKSQQNAAGFKSEPKLRGSLKASSLRLTLRDLHAHNQPGNGFLILNPEGARLENITSNGNRGYGCHIWGRDLENIMNLLDFCRFRGNGSAGLRLQNISASVISRVECLNNRSDSQMIIDGSFNHIIHPDCECFDMKESKLQGLTISGRSNRLVGGIFYKLDVAIALQGASDTLVDFPKLEGARGRPISVGVLVDGASKNCTIRIGSRNFVDKPVNDQGNGTLVEVDGRQCFRRPSMAFTKSKLSGTIGPDLTYGHNFWYDLVQASDILVPKNMQQGDIVTIVVNNYSHGRLSFSPAYRGTENALRNARDGATIILTFLAISETILILQNHSID